MILLPGCDFGSRDHVLCLLKTTDTATMLNHVSECLSFLGLRTYCFMVVPHFVFIHSSIGGHLSYFHPLGVMHNATVNTAIQIPVQVFAFTSFVYILRSEIVRPYGNYISKYLKHGPAVFHSGITILYSHR